MIITWKMASGIIHQLLFGVADHRYNNPPLMLFSPTA